jgi:hypothetical protein
MIENARRTSDDAGGRRALRFTRRAWTGVLVAAMLAGALVTAVPSARRAWLTAIGHALVLDQPISAADVIVLSLGAGPPGVLEAADLVHQGVSGAVAVFAEPPTRAELELLKRGVPYQDSAAQSLRHLASLGVSNIVRIPTSVTGTGAEASVLLPWLTQHGYRSALVITTSDHSRRAQRVLNRASNGGSIRVSVRPSRYSNFDPDAWWHDRSGTRTALIELQKLLLDIVSHPFS